VSARSLLTTVLVAAQLPADVPEASMLRGWLDSWSGVGHVVEPTHDLGFDVRLRGSPFVWWANSAETTSTRRRGGWAGPWRAVQRAALETLRQEWETA